MLKVQSIMFTPVNSKLATCGAIRIKDKKANSGWDNKALPSLLLFLCCIILSIILSLIRFVLDLVILC